MLYYIPFGQQIHLRLVNNRWCALIEDHLHRRRSLTIIESICANFNPERFHCSECRVVSSSNYIFIIYITLHLHFMKHLKLNNLIFSSLMNGNDKLFELYCQNDVNLAN